MAITPPEQQPPAPGGAHTAPSPVPPPVSAVPTDGLTGVTIDGRAVRVPKGMLVVDAATQAGIHIPVYCAHPKMDPVAVCRMCLVTVEKMPKLQPACATYVNDGMVVTTQSPQVAKAREGVLEFLLLNHPLDCPVCDRGGECDLQDFAFRYGPGTSRFPITEKVHFDKALPLSDRIELDQERCILCWRCVRYYDEITGEQELVLQERGVHTLIAPFDGQPLTSQFQGNLPEICPVGALTHKQYRFKARPWDLQRTKSVCPECSYGCNINVDTRDFEVKRFASRDNPDVDDMWLCDRGRYSAESWNGTMRIRRAAVAPRGGGRKEVSVAEAVTEAARQLKQVLAASGPESVAVMGSPDNTNEELWLLQRLARDVLGTQHVDHQLEAFDDLHPDEHALGIADIEACSAVVVLGPEPEREAPVLTLRLFKAEHKKQVRIVRVARDASPDDVVARSGGTALVGLVCDETNRGHAATVAAALTAAGASVKRLTITRGVNGRGAKDVGMLPNLLPGYIAAPPGGMAGGEIVASAWSGKLRALIVLGMSRALADGAHAVAMGKLAVLVVIDTRPGVLADAATVVIPGHTFMEKQGTVTNVEGRVQRIRQALPPSTLGPADSRILTMLARELGGQGWDHLDPVRLNRALCDAIPAYGRTGNGGRARWSGQVDA